MIDDDWLTAGIDVGATNIKLGMVTSNGQVPYRTVLKTRAYPTASAIITAMGEAVQGLCRQAGMSSRALRGVGIGVPGLVNQREGIVYRVVNAPGDWNRLPLRRILQRRLGCPCAIENDANAVALGEWQLGAGRGTREGVYLTLGTGVGGGLIVNGALVRGATGCAGEIGHTVVDRQGPRCGCGVRGCLEACIGTAAILRRARQLIRAGRSRLLARWITANRQPLSPLLISRAASEGDRGAILLWQEFGRLLGTGIASLVNLLNPERVVIGGGIAKAWMWFAPSMTATIRARAFDVPARAARVVRAKLGDRAGIIGAAVLVWENSDQ